VQRGAHDGISVEDEIEGVLFETKGSRSHGIFLGPVDFEVNVFCARAVPAPRHGT
jgi:hypothetical protein